VTGPACSPAQAGAQSCFVIPDLIRDLTSRIPRG